MKWPLVEIEWADSGSHGMWVDLSELTEDFGVECVSVGWLLSENDASITIASHLALDIHGVADQASGDMTIPKVAITKRRVLVKAKR